MHTLSTAVDETTGGAAAIGVRCRSADLAEGDLGAVGGTSGHAHRHDGPPGTPTGRYRRRLAAVLAVVATILAVELGGAVLSGSLALLADAGHVLADAGGIALALGATSLAQRPPTPRRTFGWQRLEIVAAAVNGLLLCGVAVAVLVEAVRRMATAPPVAGGTMLVVAALGLAGNALSLRLLHAGQAHSLTVRGAYVEVLGDLVGAAAVVVAAAVIAATGWTRADAVASAAVGLLILPRALIVLREAFDVLVEAAPKQVDADR